MKGKFARSIAAVAIGGLLAVTAGGVASAGTTDNGKGSSSTEAAAAQVLELRDQLTKVAYAGDVNGTARTLDDLDPLLGDLNKGERYAIQAEAMETAGAAQDLRSETADALAGKVEPRQLPEVPGLPPLPDPLSMVKGLLQSLLMTLTNLLSGLLGGGVPDLPVPEVPAP